MPEDLDQIKKYVGIISQNLGKAVDGSVPTQMLLTCTVGELQVLLMVFIPMTIRTLPSATISVIIDATLLLITMTATGVIVHWITAVSGTILDLASIGRLYRSHSYSEYHLGSYPRQHVSFHLPVPPTLVDKYDET